MGKHNPYCKQKQQNNINVSESAIIVLQCECLINNITIIVVHQIFSLACDWSKRVRWANIPQLKPMDNKPRKTGFKLIPWGFLCM